MLKDFNIKPVINTIKNPQSNSPVERVHQVILNMLVTKDIDNKVFDHIDPWGETLAAIAWAIIASYHHTIMATPCQYVVGRDILFNLASVLYCQFVTAADQKQVDIYKAREDSRQFTHNYAIDY